MEYDPVGMDHLPTNPLEGETLVCISADSLPALDPSCAMWGNHRRSLWERRAHREGEQIFVKVDRQLGKGGCALVFTGNLLPKSCVQKNLQSGGDRSVGSFSPCKPLRASIRRRTKFNAKLLNPEHNTASAAEKILLQTVILWRILRRM